MIERVRRDSIKAHKVVVHTYLILCMNDFYQIKSTIKEVNL